MPQAHRRNALNDSAYGQFTVTVDACDHANPRERHTVKWFRDGTGYDMVLDGHSPQEVASWEVETALGGNVWPTRCSEIVTLWRAAEESVAYMRGERDTSIFRSRPNTGRNTPTSVFTDNGTCETHENTARGPYHLWSPRHIAERTGPSTIAFDVTDRMSDWIWLATDPGFDGGVLGRAAKAMLLGMDGGVRNTNELTNVHPGAQDLLLHPEYVRLAYPFVGSHGSLNVVKLRRTGARIEWLRDLTNTVDLDRLRHRNWSRNERDSFTNALGGARNIPAAVVADYINNDVYRYFYSYYRAGVVPGDVARYEQVTRRTLAQDLVPGVAVERTFATAGVPFTRGRA